MAIFSVPTLTLASVILALYYFARTLLEHLRYESKRRQLGGAQLARYTHSPWAPLGLDYVSAMMKAIKEDRFLPFQVETYFAQGNGVWTANFLGKRMIYSSHPENMKAMSTSLISCFAVEPIRIANGAITPFTGRGVSSSDGQKWQCSRNLIMSYFDRAGFTRLRRLDIHVDRLLRNIPTNGSKVDMQPLFQRWVSRRSRLGIGREESLR